MMRFREHVRRHDTTREQEPTRNHTYHNVEWPSTRERSNKILALGYLASFACGWIIANAGKVPAMPVLTREAKQVSYTDLTLVQAPIPYTNTGISVSHLLSQRPNWRGDYELVNWLPRWLPTQAVERFKSLRHNETHQRVLDVELELGRDEYFWKSLVDPTDGWKSNSSSFTYAIASNGFGHRLGNLAFSYLCNVFPNKKQQVIFWETPGTNYNIAWHALFEDSPILIGAPQHWNGKTKFDHVNRHRARIGQQGEIQTSGFYKGTDSMHCDYKEYFPIECGGDQCLGFDFSRDTWLLRLAREPSAQEFFMLLRAQLRQHVKDKIASFIETHFPKDKIVVGVHIRSGNGKDDGEGDFDKKKRGDWLHENLPAAVAMVRNHARMVAYSIIDRYNQELDFATSDYHPEMPDNHFRIFLATDSIRVLKEFQRQDPHVLFVPQERMEDGAGVPIKEPLICENMTTSECSIHAEEAMFIDAMIMSSCDVALSESFSNWMYTLPATLRLAEGRIFCETGRAALGVKEEDSIYGPASWWAHPPPNTMPVRCYQGAWAARDRSNLLAVADVP